MHFKLEAGCLRRGHVLITWVEDGRFVCMHNAIDAPDGPWSACIIGTADGLETYMMPYYDWQTVTRIYHISLILSEWKQWQDAPGFYQCFTGMLSSDHNTITSHWEKSSDDGVTWQHDFGLIYRRVASSLE